MTKTASARVFAHLGLAALLAACSEPAREVSELARYPIADLAGVIAGSGVELDREVTSDGNGSLRVRVDGPTTLRLFETGDVDVEDARLTYQARIRTEGVEGRAYLEMWCVFEGRGEYFSRNLDAALSGTNEWSTQETPFFLQKGENPSRVKLNLVIEGKGTVWIDDVRLLAGPR